MSGVEDSMDHIQEHGHSWEPALSYGQQSAVASFEDNTVQNTLRLRNITGKRQLGGLLMKAL